MPAWYLCGVLLLVAWLMLGGVATLLGWTGFHDPEEPPSILASALDVMSVLCLPVGLTTLLIGAVASFASKSARDDKQD